MSVLRYPSDFHVSSRDTDYIEFCAVRRRYGETATSGEVKYDYDPTSVILNVPQKVIENHSQNWNNAALGAITPELIGKIARSGADLISGNDALGATLNFATEVGKEGAGLIQDFAMRRILEMAAQGMQSMGASGITDNGILSAAGGIVFNPNLEVLYEGPDFRTFNFQFAMFNKSEEDAAEIYKIVEWFRNISVPSKNTRNWSTSSFSGNRGDQANSGPGNDGTFGTGTYGQGWPSDGEPAPGTKNVFGNTAVSAGGKAGWSFSTKSKFLQQPPLLLMTYMRGGTDHPFMRPLLPAAINSVSIDYTPTGNYTVMNNFGDTRKATTVAATITIQITERTNLTVEDLNEFESKAGTGTSKEYRAPKG